MYLAALLVFWVLALAGHFFWAHWMGHAFSVKQILFKGAKDAFDDFTMFNAVTNRFGPPEGPQILVYPAPMMCAYVFFSLFPHPLLVYEAFIAVSALAAAGALAYLVTRDTRHRLVLATSVFTSLALSYPLIFTMERAQMEAVVWFVQVLAITAFVMRRNMTAGLLIALAASMKIYPGLLFLLLLSRRKYKEFALSILAVIPISLLALWIVGPSVRQASRDVAVGLGLLGGSHIFHLIRTDLGFDHSLFSFVKQALRIHFRDEPDAQVAIGSASLPYLVFAAFAFLVLYWFRIRKLPVLNQIMALVLLSTLLPPLSMEYTLIQLYIPWAVFLLFLVRDRVAMPLYAALAILVCFAFIFAPAGYISGRTIGIGGQVKVFAMLTILYLACRIPLPSSLFGELRQA